jgi:2-dehydropantoate 2-reductase
MHHFIVGPGGVGGLIAGVLAHSGETVSVVPGSSGHPDRITVESRMGNFTAPVRVAKEVDQSCDVVWIATKSLQLESALQRIPRDASIGAIVPLLNGIDHLRVLRDRYGNDRVVAATIAVESERVTPGHIVHRSPFARLHVASAGRERLQSAIDLFSRFGFECKFVDDEPTLMWSKLVFLAPIALATTAASVPIGGLLDDPERKRGLEAMVHEACAVGVQEGAKVKPDFVIQNLPNLPRDMRSSMQKDVDAGRTPELDAIAGPILRGGDAHGVPVPVTLHTCDAIRRRMAVRD